MKINILIKNSYQLIVLLLISTSVLSQSKLLDISNYWLRAAPPNAMMQAAYGELSNKTGKNVKLIGAYSPAFNMAEIHKTTITDGIARMVHQPELMINKGNTLKFEPGGLHIMLMHPTIKFKQGDSIKINLIYMIDGQRKVEETWFPVEKK